MNFNADILTFTNPSSVYYLDNPSTELVDQVVQGASRLTTQRVVDFVRVAARILKAYKSRQDNIKDADNVNGFILSALKYSSLSPLRGLAARIRVIENDRVVPSFLSVKLAFDGVRRETLRLPWVDVAIINPLNKNLNDDEKSRHKTNLPSRLKQHQDTYDAKEEDSNPSVHLYLRLFDTDVRAKDPIIRIPLEIGAVSGAANAIQREVSSPLTTVGETVEISILSYVPFEYKMEANNQGRTRTQTGETFIGTVYSSDNNEVMTTSGTLAITNDGFKLKSKLFDIVNKKEVVTLTTDILQIVDKVNVHQLPDTNFLYERKTNKETTQNNCNIASHISLRTSASDVSMKLFNLKTDFTRTIDLSNVTLQSSLDYLLVTRNPPYTNFFLDHRHRKSLESSKKGPAMLPPTLDINNKIHFVVDTDKLFPDIPGQFACDILSDLDFQLLNEVNFKLQYNSPHHQRSGLFTYHAQVDKVTQGHVFSGTSKSELQWLATIPASNTIIERLSSTTKNVVTEKTTRLDCEKINQMLFLQKNMEIFKELLNSDFRRKRTASMSWTTTVSSEESTCTAPKQLCLDVDDSFNHFNK
ncbi:unnamed protein product [Rotaria socialis]